MPISSSPGNARWTHRFDGFCISRQYDAGTIALAGNGRALNRVSSVSDLELIDGNLLGRPSTR
ncbi:hypothetical protein RS86_01651 [Microbacterium azadirachtae]|uniref:Uncharacterized protein n=1 Tax=Microbacterium azadirachtae TaxID=582680 RepID=A0A0F0LMC9_9MICO|nr:hypothetical protein [Microbacterium azadirachtae]KJL33430.1 hypothetical protein RS86_01651 [Microbacterium azadirachtae]